MESVKRIMESQRMVLVRLTSSTTNNKQQTTPTPQLVVVCVDNKQTKTTLFSFPSFVHSVGDDVWVMFRTCCVTEVKERREEEEEKRDKKCTAQPEDKPTTILPKHYYTCQAPSTIFASQNPPTTIRTSKHTPTQTHAVGLVICVCLIVGRVGESFEVVVFDWCVVCVCYVLWLWLCVVLCCLFHASHVLDLRPYPSQHNHTQKQNNNNRCNMCAHKTTCKHTKHTNHKRMKHGNCETAVNNAKDDNNNNKNKTLQHTTYNNQQTNKTTQHNTTQPHHNITPPQKQLQLNPPPLIVSVCVCWFGWLSVDFGMQILLKEFGMWVVFGGGFVFWLCGTFCTSCLYLSFFLLRLFSLFHFSHTTRSKHHPNIITDKMNKKREKRIELF